MAISVRLHEDEELLIKDYARLNNISVSEIIRQSVLEKIENEIDLGAYNKAMLDYKKDSTKYTLDEVEKELGLI